MCIFSIDTIVHISGERPEVGEAGACGGSFLPGAHEEHFDESAVEGGLEFLPGQDVSGVHDFRGADDRYCAELGRFIFEYVLKIVVVGRQV